MKFSLTYVNEQKMSNDGKAKMNVFNVCQTSGYIYLLWNVPVPECTWILAGFLLDSHHEVKIDLHFDAFFLEQANPQGCTQPMGYTQTIVVCDCA